jgi:hypothetical protein
MTWSWITQGPLSVCETHWVTVFSLPPLKFRTAGFPQYGFKREVRHDLRRGRPRLIRGASVVVDAFGPCGQAPCGVTASFLHTLSSRGPWLASRLCCPARSMLTMASSEPLVAPERLICFVRSGLRRRVGPQFKLPVCSYMPSPGPRWIEQVQLTVASLFTMVFARFAVARHPHRLRTLVLAQIVSRGGLRFACAAACTMASPSPTRTSTTELSPVGSPRSDVSYDYTGKQSTPATGLTPARQAAVWAANESHE